MAQIEITREVAAKVLNVVDAGLVKGVGEPVAGQMCVEAAVNYALGRDHGDDPGCVSQAVRALKIRLNDANWSSNTARSKGLRRLALAQLGSLGTVDDQDFANRVVKLAIQKTPHISNSTLPQLLLNARLARGLALTGKNTRRISRTHERSFIQKSVGV